MKRIFAQTVRPFVMIFFVATGNISACARAMALGLTAIIFFTTSVFAGDPVFDLTRKADRLADERQYDQALAAYTRAIEMSKRTPPESSEAHFNRGNVYFNLREYPKAIADYTKGLELRRKWASQDPLDVLMNLADAYRLNGDDARAIAAYENFLRIYPKAGLASDARNRIAQLRQSRMASTATTTTAFTFKDERRFCGREMNAMVEGYLRVNTGNRQDQALDFATRRFYAQINTTNEGLLRQNIQTWAAITRPDNPWLLDLCAARLSLGRLVGIKQAQQRARHESVDIETLVEVIPPGSPKSANPGG